MQSLTPKMQQLYDQVAPHAVLSTNELPEERYERVVQIPGLLEQIRESSKGISSHDISSLSLEDPKELSDQEFETGFLVFDLLQLNGLLPLQTMHDAPPSIVTTETKELIDRLMTACIYGDIPSIEAVAGRLGSNIVDHNFQTPLMYAIGNNHHESVVRLVQLGADVNLITPNGETALHFAASTLCSYSTFEYLVLNGGKIDIKDFQGRTSKDLLVLNERKNWVKLLDALNL